MPNNIKYLLFDLDDTLIRFDLNTFIQNYLRLIQNNFSHLVYAKSVPEWILGGTNEMLNSVKTITNKEKFLNYFQAKSGLSEGEIWEIFLHFYNTDYNQLKKITKPVGGAKSFLETAKTLGREFVVQVKGIVIERQSKNPNIPTDVKEQADCYQVFIETFWDEPWLTGIYWWHWDTKANLRSVQYPNYKPDEQV